MPIRNGYADDVYVVTSGEKMSLYAAENIARAVEQFKARGYAQLGGLILNSRNVENERELVNKTAEKIDTDVIHHIPRHSLVQEAEELGKTVVEAFPDSDLSEVYYELAGKI